MSASFKNALRGFITHTAEKKLTKELIPPEKFKQKGIKKILIVCGNKRFHEVILSLPAFKAIRRQFPKAKITTLFEEQFVALKDQFDVCDEVRPIHREALSWSVRELKDFIEMLKDGFDLVMVFNTKGHSYFDAIVAHFSKAKYILGSELSLPKRGENYFPFNLLAPASSKAHEPSEYYRSVLRHIGIKGYRAVNKLLLGEQLKESAQRILQYNGIKRNELIVGIALSPEQGEKLWPIENYVELAKHFSSRIDAKIMVFCNPADTNIAARFEDGLPFKPFRADEYTVAEQSALMTHCSLVICTNIDFMYLAYTVGTPVIALYSSREEKYRKPGKDKFIAIHPENEDISTIQTKKVIEAAKSVLRSKVFDEEKTLDISERALDDYLGFGDIIETYK